MTIMDGVDSAKRHLSDQWSLSWRADGARPWKWSCSCFTFICTTPTTPSYPLSQLISISPLVGSPAVRSCMAPVFLPPLISHCSIGSSPYCVMALDNMRFSLLGLLVDPMIGWKGNLRSRLWSRTYNHRRSRKFLCEKVSSSTILLCNSRLAYNSLLTVSSIVLKYIYKI